MGTDAFAVSVTWFVTTGFGVLTGIGLALAVTGRAMLKVFGKDVWSSGENKLSGLSWATCGLAGAVWVLVFDLDPARASGLPWREYADNWPMTYLLIVISNPWPLVFLLTGLCQGLIDLHHNNRWPFRRNRTE